MTWSEEPELHDPRLATLYRQAADEVPGAALDARIRGAARRALGTRRRTRQRVWLASAATLVLALGLGWQFLPPPGTGLARMPDLPVVDPPSGVDRSPAPTASAEDAADRAGELAAPPSLAAKSAASAAAGLALPRGEAQGRAGMAQAVCGLTPPTRLADWRALIAARRQAGDRATADCLAAEARLRWGPNNGDPPPRRGH